MDSLANFFVNYNILSLECAKSLFKDLNISKWKKKKESKNQIFFFPQKKNYQWTANMKCISALFSKLIGFVIIGASFILKVPQIINILKGGIEGLSLMMFFLEFIIFSVNGVWNFFYSHKRNWNAIWLIWLQSTTNQSKTNFLKFPSYEIFIQK